LWGEAVGFDLIGSREKAVAIVEIPKDKNGKKIAEEIMIKNKNVKSVLKKLSKRRGKFRLRECKLVAGDRNTEVTHIEHGYLLKLDPQKVYFSPREATERQRVAEQVEPKETVLVIGSGVAVLPIAIAKKQSGVEKVVGIEINKAAHKYAEENVRINKLAHKITLVSGDAKTKCKKYFGRCTRVLIPLPLESEKFLDVAMKCLKPGGGIIHFYSVGIGDDLFSGSLLTIKKSAKRLGKRIKILNKKEILPYAPGKWKVCIDFKVS